MTRCDPWPDEREESPAEKACLKQQVRGLLGFAALLGLPPTILPGAAVVGRPLAWAVVGQRVIRIDEGIGPSQSAARVYLFLGLRFCPLFVSKARKKKPRERRFVRYLDTSQG